MRKKLVGVRCLLSVIPLAALAVAGCSKNSDTKAPGGPTGQQRGMLLQNPPVLVTTLTTTQLLAKLGASTGLALLGEAGSPLCDVNVYRINYTTVGGANEDTTATGALMTPSGSDAKCHGARPIVLYAHGTTTEKAYDISNLDDSENAEGLYLAAFFAAHGNVVVAPNYAGYGGSTLPYHPYLVADQQSKDMIDALAAARSALPTAAAADTTDSGRLYITGYSQGGYVAMATQRAMEAAGMPVTASAPLSGPYALEAFVDAIFFGHVIGGAPVLGTLLFTAYQKSYGNIYSSPTDLFAAQYATGIDSLLPSDKRRSQLYTDGLLPQYAFFNDVPPDPAYAQYTPATTPANLAPVFARGFGPQPLVLNSYRLAYLQDAQANPDGFWPETNTAAPAANPALPLRQALKTNDLRNWAPISPTLLCGGDNDPTVLWLNTQAMQSYWTAKAPSAPYAVLDVDAAPTGSDDPYQSIKQRFGVAKDVVAASGIAQGATDGGNAAVLEVYHAGLVAPFCLEAAAEFFSAHP